MTSYRLYRFIGWFCIGTALTLTLLRALLPLYTPSVESFNSLLQSKLPYPVTTESTAFAWEGLYPAMVLSNVDIKQSHHAAQSIHIDKVKLVLSIRHLLLGRFALKEAVIDGADFSIDYRVNDKIVLKELPDLYYDLNSEGKIIPIDHLRFIHCNIQVTRDEHTLSLQNVNLKATIGNHVRANLHAEVVGKKGATVDARFNVPLLGHAPIKGYVHWVGAELQSIATLYPLNLPFSKIDGYVDMKTWLKLKEDDIQLNADLAFTDLNLTTHENKLLNFDKVGGLFHVRRHHAKWEIIAERGYWDEIQHTRFALHNQSCEEANCWELKARHLPLKPLHDFAHLFTNKVAPFDTKGEIEYLNMTFDETMKPKQVELVFNDIGLFKPKEGGIAGLTGALTYQDGRGSLQLMSPRFNIHYPAWFSQVIPLTEVAANIRWSHENNALRIVADEVTAKLGDTPIEGSLVTDFTGENKLPRVEMQWHVGAMQTQAALDLLPITMDIDLLEWLNQAIKLGSVDETSILLRGELSEFPFDKQEGIFEVHTQLSKTSLDYTQGWPALSDMTASLLFRNRALYINAEHALIEGGELVKADAVIPDLFNPLPALRIDTKINSTLENGLKVIHKSPLKDTLGKELAVLTLEGDMNLSLGLDIPLSAESQDDVKVRGVIALQEGTVGVPEWNLNIPHVSGEVSFTENGVKAPKLTGYLFESPAEFRVNSMLTPEGSELKVNANGKLVSDRLLSWLKASDVKQVTGDTDYQAELIVNSGQHAKQVDLNISTNLVGITVDAPLPLAKQANELRVSECKIHFDQNDLTRISLKYGDSLNAAYSMLRQTPDWRPMGGHIHIGENRLAKHREDGILLLDGDLSELDVEKWQEFAKKTGVGLPTDKPVLEPLIELKIASLKMLGEDFTNVGLEAQWERNFKHWNVVFDGSSLKGHLILPQDESQDIRIDLQKLSLTSNNETSNFWKDQEQTQKKQPIDIKIKDFNIDKKFFSDIQVRLIPSPRGYDFNPVKAKIKETTIELTGEWSYLADKKVSAHGTVTTENIGDTLLALGKEGTLKGASGTVEFTLEWEGTPAKIDYASLGGHAALSLHQGYVQGVNPGIGRILSLLNLDNVKRRLKLDFGDVTKSGFAFDELNAKFQFGKGKVSSNKITLNGPSAKIEAFGQADLISQGLSGEMVVMPDVTGSLPVAAAIASANPAIGAAVWVVDRMFGNKIQEINRFRYQILGSWQTPLVKEVPIVSTPSRG